MFETLNEHQLTLGKPESPGNWLFELSGKSMTLMPGLVYDHIDNREISDSSRDGTSIIEVTTSLLQCYAGGEINKALVAIQKHSGKQLHLKLILNKRVFSSDEDRKRTLAGWVLFEYVGDRCVRRLERSDSHPFVTDLMVKIEQAMLDRQLLCPYGVSPVDRYTFTAGQKVTSLTRPSFMDFRR